VAHRVYVGIGSNLGDRRANARDAIERIGRLPDTRVVGTSALYESEPLGNATTWFVNAAIAVDTALAPQELLDRLLAIEVAMGRVRVAGERWGPRIIDLDILLVDRQVIDTPTLTVPHPAMHERRFVLTPLAEIAPDAIHPLLGRSVATLLATVRDDKRVTPLGPD
jgi:2-amino-4-hydroxy-6-hydroxymethyldihydropteridine diphosphokinase